MNKDTHSYACCKDKPAEASGKPGLLQRIISKLDSAMKAKADAKASGGCCCQGDDQGKGGRCC